MNSTEAFGQRKKDHIAISLRPESQAHVNQFHKVELQHQPLPEIDFADIDLTTEVFGHTLQSPMFVSSMTLGHDDAQAINLTLAESCQERGWMMGVGSQRRQLFDQEAHAECQKLREKFPELVLFGNIGLSQVISHSPGEIKKLVDSLGAQFLAVHTNPLQEALQKEGTPQFSGGLRSLDQLTQELDVPVVLKETGCGFSQSSLQKLANLNLGAIDISGLGGTHWGRVEGLRESKESMIYKAAETFAYWGVSTVDSCIAARQIGLKIPIWASGGVRTGLDACKLLALGARMVGFAQPMLHFATKGPEDLRKFMELLEFELRTAMFCLGSKDLAALTGNEKLWKII